MRFQLYYNGHFGGTNFDQAMAWRLACQVSDRDGVVVDVVDMETGEVVATATPVGWL